MYIFQEPITPKQKAVDKPAPEGVIIGGSVINVKVSAGMEDYPQRLKKFCESALSSSGKTKSSLPAEEISFS